jgi:hypothetical protein
VHVADQLAVAGGNREAGEAGGRDQGLHGGGGDRLRDGDQPLAGQQDGGSGALAEGEGVHDEVVLLAAQQTFPAGLLDQPGDLLGGVGVPALVDRLDLEHPQDGGRGGGQADDHRPEQPDEPEQRRGEQHGRPLRPGQGDVLGHHLASSMCSTLVSSSARAKAIGCSTASGTCTASKAARAARRPRARRPRPGRGSRW